MGTGIAGVRHGNIGDIGVVISETVFLLSFFMTSIIIFSKKKSRIQETKNLLLDADSSTYTKKSCF